MASENLASETIMTSFPLPGTGYAYGATPVASLQSPEHTLAMTLFDESGSTHPWRQEMELMVKQIVRFLRDSPRADNLLYAHNHFDTTYREVHGFKPLIDCNEADYDGCWDGGNATTLYDSTIRALASVSDYAKQHAVAGYTTNGILCILTDGLDNRSGATPEDVKAELATLVSAECLESMMTILIGINDDPQVHKALELFAAGADFTQYVRVADARAEHLARVARFIATSTQQQSLALGTGGPSTPLTF